MAEDHETQRLLREVHGTLMRLDERTLAMVTQHKETKDEVAKIAKEHDNLAARMSTLEGDHKGMMVKLSVIVGGALIAVDAFLRKTIF